jgi:hypothetical protein
MVSEHAESLLSSGSDPETVIHFNLTLLYVFQPT